VSARKALRREGKALQHTQVSVNIERFWTLGDRVLNLAVHRDLSPLREEN
jgi:hypothetical protein